jgi:hypothetical protein
MSGIGGNYANAGKDQQASTAHIVNHRIPFILSSRAYIRPITSTVQKIS